MLEKSPQSAASDILPGKSAAATAEPARFGLAARILLLTIAFVMVAEVAIYIPSIANFRNAWLRDRLAAATTAALVFDAASTDMIPAELRNRILHSVGAQVIVIKSKARHRLLAVSDMPRQVDETYDLRNPSPWEAIAAAFRCLTAPPGRTLTVLGDSPMGAGMLEITLEETPLKKAMRHYSIDILKLSLLISLIVAGLGVAAIHLLVLRPVRRLTSSILAFGENPEDATRIIKASGRRDEIGRAEAALAAMQGALVRELAQKKHLAALGLAVAKINHDLRNMLGSAQLFSDRLTGLSDPLAQRLAPKLVGTLDRAIAFCQATLAYGRAVEAPPKLSRFALKPVVADVADTAAPAEISSVTIENKVPDDLEVTADPEQMFRVLMNLCRNAVEAIEGMDKSIDPPGKVSIEARAEPGRVMIDVTDTGPGIPPHLRAGLFEAFHGSTRAGGTGLGLAIAADLVRAHGGSVNLVDVVRGATFRIVLPEHPGAPV
ncbi:MAG: HAMP domain-containing histidine kinase [Methylobacteriaceae bacterium]|nr:HAMP domain-containing histidine kinase [Methylobacteriaceae bacterium]